MRCCWGWRRALPEAEAARDPKDRIQITTAEQLREELQKPGDAWLLIFNDIDETIPETGGEDGRAAGTASVHVHRLRRDARRGAAL
ncbi:MAG: hypothetical protein IJU66_05195 [Oscillospiraceae bacterium]|nr:hypothetical protein [Oscillospiraceae bacterium]